MTGPEPARSTRRPHPTEGLTVRRTLIVSLAPLLLLLAACGASGQGGAAAPSSATPSSSSADGAFPVTVPTAFGDVTVEQEPRRVVALGWGDAETALALGVQPVGASDWLGYGGDGVGPWLEGAYDTAPTIVSTTETSPEAVAALRPDLILDTRSDGTDERHDQLAQVAPVLGAPQGVVAFGTTWRQQLEMVGDALGRGEQAEAVRARTEAALDEVAAQHPGLDGATVAVGAYFDGGYGAYVTGDPRVDLLAGLGMENSPAVDALGDGSFYVDVSKERLDLLDADVTVVFPIGADAADFTSDPLYRTIPSVAAGRDVVLEDQTLTDAFSSGTAPGVSYAAQRVAPLLSEALAGPASP